MPRFMSVVATSGRVNGRVGTGKFTANLQLVLIADFSTGIIVDCFL